MNELPFYGTGNLTDDPELRFTPGGTAVANANLASTPRRYDKQSQQWVHGDSTFVRLNTWGAQAENSAETLKRGTRVVVQGTHARTRRRTAPSAPVHEVRVTEIGPSLLFATASARRSEPGRQADRATATNRRSELPVPERLAQHRVGLSKDGWKTGTDGRLA
jgi:single-strand DNA-binding protein